jgi:aldehyde:ferredoxin oxidoreductase
MPWRKKKERKLANMDVPGYAGHILHVDLTRGSIRKEKLDPELVTQFIGGWGINSRLAYDCIPPDVDSLSPENAIIVGTGPFNGTIVPGSAELAITTKLPLSGGIGVSCGGGHFPLMLKASGYDHIVITGSSPTPVYLKILNDDVELLNADDIWGKDTYETVDTLRLRHEPCSIIPIGPSGENLVKISITFIDKGGTLGFGGLPAVMGSKNLKALVACQGVNGIRVADSRGLKKAVDRMMKRIMDYRMRPTLIEGGTFAMTSGWLGAMGLDLGDWDRIHKESRRTLACPSCPMGDKELNRLREGEYSPMTAYMTDFMGEFESSGKNQLDNHNRAVKRVDTLNRTGICKIHFSNVMRLMTSLYHQGIITKEDTGGIEIKRDYETLLRLVEMTANREGIGDVMAEGPLGAVQKIGGDAESHAIHIKGCAPFIDPRADSMNTMALAQMVHPGRANYACGGSGIYMQGRPIEQFLSHARRMGIPEDAIDRIFTADSFNVGTYTKHTEDWYSLFNTFGQCHRLYIHRFHGIDNFVEFYTAITGMKTEPDELLRHGERVWNMYKLINARLGFERKHDQPPKAWFEPLKRVDKEFRMMDYYKTTVLTEEDMEQMLNDYYDERGWDRNRAAPTLEKLKELGLEGFKDVI